MFKVINENDFCFDNFQNIIKEMFFEYPYIIDWILNKVLPTTKNKEYLKDFVENLRNINIENLNWNFNQEAENLFINNLINLLDTFDSLKNNQERIFKNRNLELEENNKEEFNIMLTEIW